MPLDPTDDVAIRRLVHRYADAVVHRDAERWGTCWTEDATWELGPGRVVHGRDAILGLWRSSMGSMAAVVQLVHNGAVEAADEPDRAAGRWYVDERFRRPDGTNGILLAHYDDAYVRDADGEWRFARRTLQCALRRSARPDGRLPQHARRAGGRRSGRRRLTPAFGRHHQPCIFVQRSSAPLTRAIMLRTRSSWATLVEPFTITFIP